MESDYFEKARRVTRKKADLPGTCLLPITSEQTHFNASLSAITQLHRMRSFLLFPAFYLVVLTGRAEAGEGITAFSFLLGQATDDTVHQIHFRPEDSAKFRKKFEAKHGPRGSLLIEKLGRGYSEEVPSILEDDHAITKPPVKKVKNVKARGKKNIALTTTVGTPTTIAPTTIDYSTLETTYSTGTPYGTTDYYPTTTDIFQSTVLL
ncbi:uncharacterized protein LOC111047711 [Nilaparvata lugens]|uniref:uncharacterized protein LOC111047711 n=1 Tax=Nilaparvata lugens TaxID=108931 RepID=UPI00193CD749|nr:uncharacterized protein LOC111047711 [Nilaparvata lugens]